MTRRLTLGTRTAGTAQDVSFLIDFLSSYLFPNDERTISQWLVTGISLGGHSTWITLKNGKLARSCQGRLSPLTLCTVRTACKARHPHNWYAWAGATLDC